MLPDMSWKDQDEAAELQEDLERQLRKRREQGEKLEAFAAPSGTKLTHQFWGGAWARHLENYCGYEGRLDRGRTLLRKGKILDLEAQEGVVTAVVADGRLHGVRITVQPTEPEQWAELKATCSGQVDSLLDLLQGRLGDAVMQTVTDPERGLFPDRREIRHHCDCLDEADLCRHQAAVLYATAILFDRDPRFFFQLRGVDPAELIDSSRHAAVLTETGSPDAGLAEDEDLSALFGIDLAPPPDSQP